MVASVNAFLHICEVCGARATLTPDESYEAGWDYPPRTGVAGVISPRKCGDCPITGTLWWAVQEGELDSADPLGWPAARREVLARILNEQTPVPPG
ncbi:hypothetical protein GY24_04185 [Microterricola pindariensis]|uniref:Uncharacterized protein n=1 Tax=Microterricola pindariensis TaxID=478010 RepID=A0ABX5AZE2_9MICO|nr:hypothetical protein GY24_04185 [Microterricola pindariensis]